jgi:hypothetical protein
MFVPYSFIAKDGRRIIARPHIAVFNKKHNACKAKVLILLYHRKYIDNTVSGLRIRDVHKLTGVSYEYIKFRVSKWVAWGYLSRQGDSKPYTYSIADRGRHIVEDIIPREWLEYYIGEIRAHKAQLSKQSLLIHG